MRNVYIAALFLCTLDIPVHCSIIEYKPSNIDYRQTSNIRVTSVCWSLRCNWSILDLTPGFNGLGKDNSIRGGDWTSLIGPPRLPAPPPYRTPLTPSTAPSTHPNGTPLTPSTAPLRLPAPTPTAPRTTPPTAPSAAPSTHPHGTPHLPAQHPLHNSQHPPPRHPTPHPPPRPAQPPRLVSRFPHRKNSGGQITKMEPGFSGSGAPERTGHPLAGLGAPIRGILTTLCRSIPPRWTNNTILRGTGHLVCGSGQNAS